MECYLVGGAVRDDLLGLAVEDRDWVVVGGDRQSLVDLGFRPVDAAFPVFLHPETGEEYALARRERKAGEGYHGFEVEAGPDVTLEEDLRRRDLTINAMARDEAGRIIDPYGGQTDLEKGLLRHVSPAFVEDPLRVLRVARFAAKLAGFGFHVSHETHRLMCQMADGGDLAALTAERLWREMKRAMVTTHPWRFFEVLQRCGALQTLLPPLAGAMGEGGSHAETEDSPAIAALKRVCEIDHQPSTRLVALLMGVLSGTDAADLLMKQLRADRTSARLLGRAIDARDLCAEAARGETEALVQLALAWQGVEPATMRQALIAVCDAQHADSGSTLQLSAAIDACREVTAGPLRASGLQGVELGHALSAARADAARSALPSERR